jgi:CcmD family protein
VDLEKWQNLGYLFWAYVTVWAFLAGYLVIMTRRMSRLRREIDLLREETKRRATD